MPKRCFYGVLTIFLFSLSFWAGSGKPCMTAHSINGTSRHSRQTNREEWFYPSDQTRLAKQIKTYFLADGLPGFTLPAMFFSVGDVFFTDFSFEVFLSNLPPLPFTSIFAPFSGPHQAVIFVLGAKVTPGLDGKARSSLLFSEKISSPAGSILAEKLSQVMIISLQWLSSYFSVSNFTNCFLGLFVWNIGFPKSVCPR